MTKDYTIGEPRLLRALGHYADAQIAGKPFSIQRLGERMGCPSEAHAIRRLLMRRGLLVTMQAGVSRRPAVMRLTPAGWEAIDREPPAAPRDPAASGAARICLGCGGGFLSEGRHNRICGRCKDTDAWRAGI